MKKNIPIRQHYIPQFILRNFCIENNLVNYYDITEKKLKVMDVKNIFMENYFYNDEINYSDSPEQIEKDLSKFESEVAPIINKKFLIEDSFTLTREEDDKLKLFFAIMGLRNIHARDTFSNYSKSSKEFFKQYQSNLNFIDYWKRNLGYLVNCRSLNDVLKHDKIDEPIKTFMIRDCFNVVGQYFLVFEKRGTTNFVIGDAYPTDIRGDNQIHCYSYYPISPDRLILVVSKGVEHVPAGVLDFEKSDLKSLRNPLSIHVKKIYEENVLKINEDIIRNSVVGYIIES